MSSTLSPPDASVTACKPIVRRDLQRLHQIQPAIDIKHEQRHNHGRCASHRTSLFLLLRPSMAAPLACHMSHFLSPLDTTVTVRSCAGMFAWNYAFNQPVNFDTSRVTDMTCACHIGFSLFLLLRPSMAAPLSCYKSHTLGPLDAVVTACRLIVCRYVRRDHRIQSAFGI